MGRGECETRREAKKDVFFPNAFLKPKKSSARNGQIGDDGDDGDDGGGGRDEICASEWMNQKKCEKAGPVNAT